MSFDAEPAGWFIGAEGGPLVTFSMSDPDWCSHWDVPECPVTGGQPHRWQECEINDRGEKARNR